MTSAYAPLNETDDSVLIQNNGQYETLLAKGTKSPHDTYLRWVVLMTACFMGFGVYYSYDIPQALQAIMTDEHELNLSNFQFNLLYTMYSIPNIILPFFGGILIDRMGIRRAILLFCFLVALGQAFNTVGAAQHNFPVMLIGRVILGVGGESLGVSQSVIITKWFFGRELAFAISFTSCVTGIGHSVNSFLTPKIYLWTNQLYMGPLCGLFACFLALLCATILAFIDRKADAKLASDESAVAEEEPAASFKDLKELSLLFFLLLLTCFFLYGAYFGLDNNLNDIMVKRFGYTPDEAGNFIPIISICASIIPPFFGYYSDRKGKRVTVMIVGAAIFLGVHLGIAYLQDTPEGSPNYNMVTMLFGMGIFYASFAGVFWPCIPLVVSEKLIGTAYGIATSMYNLILSINPMVIGEIHDETVKFHEGYFWTQISLSVLTAAGLVLAIWVYFVDKKTGSRLEKSSQKEE